MRPRRAAALPSVLFVVAMLGAMMVGTAYAGRTAATATRLHEKEAHADWPAESTLVAMLEQWDSTERAAQGIGQTVTWRDTNAVRTITRLGATLYLVMAGREGRLPQPLRRRLAVFVVTDSLGVRPIPNRAWMALP